MKAVWNGKIIAEAPRKDVVYIEGMWYFPRWAVKQEYLRNSATQTTCPWRGECRYFDVGQGALWGKDNAWTYPNPDAKAIHKVKKDFSGHVAFWNDVQVSDDYGDSPKSKEIRARESST